VRREIEALREEPFLDIAHLECAPFHWRTPQPARDLGDPIASAVLVQEYLIGLVFLRICGWIFLPIGLLMALGSLIAMVSGLLGAHKVQTDALIGGAIGMAVGLGIAGAGAWFGILRGRVINERCWFCSRGMVWMTEQVFEWFEWEDIPEVYAKMDGDRPAVGIRFTGPISWISFSSSPSSRMVVRYVENRASAAWLPVALRLLAEGKTIRLGEWRLHRLTLEDASNTYPWTQVSAVRSENGEIVFTRNDGRPEMSIWWEEVPMPSLLLALARALVAFTRDRR
jgi:hypothetical protein